MIERRGFGLYVHWPFCQSKCPYCDFNSHVSNNVDQRAWQEAFRLEIQRASTDLPNRTLNSIFFGGGTPSLMTPETVETVISSARAAWPFANDIEISLEANPTSVEAARFQCYANVGVNRVSIGVQALNDHDLRQLGRLHDADEARRSVDLANEIFPRTSFDLIYARQDQTIASWEQELGEALSMAKGHLSLYQLTIEPLTAFGDRFAKGSLRGLPDDDLAADMYEMTQSMTEAAGLRGYEISNHAAPGQESVHNLIYWKGHDWVGVGPGAHGRFSIGAERVATEAYQLPQKWLEFAKRGNGETARRTLTKLDDVEERLMMGLRLSVGVSESEFPEYVNKFSDLVEIGVLKAFKGRVFATDRGRPLLNAIVRELLA